MSERAQISDRETGPDSRVSRRAKEPTDGPVSAHDRMLALQRSAGNSAVSARIEAVQRAGETPAIDPASAGSANVQRAGFFSKVWSKIKGWFTAKKPKTGPPVESATSEGETSTSEMTSTEEKNTSGPEQTGETSGGTSTEGGTESKDGGTSSSTAGQTESTEGGTESKDGGTSSSTAGQTESTEGGTESKDGGAQETTESESTESKDEATGPVAPETKKTVPEHPSPPPLTMDLASGEAVLKNAFGTMKTIVPGKIEILAPAAFKEAYDKIYGAGQWSWDRYVVPTYGSLNGFAHDGTNYINTGSAGLHTVVHEMLHNNAAADWIPAVGSRFNEGTTEILTQVACKKLSVDAPVCYPGESPCVQALLDAGLPLADLEAAYLNGGAADKIGKWVDANCKENWAACKGYMEAKNWDAAKAGFAKKAA